MVNPWDVPLDRVAVATFTLEWLHRRAVRDQWEVEHLRTATAGWENTADETGEIATILFDAYTQAEADGLVRWDPWVDKGRGHWVEVPPPLVVERTDGDVVARFDGYRQKMLAGMLEDVASATVGTRWATLTRCSFRAGEYGLPRDAVDELAHASNLDEPLRARIQTARSAWKKGTRKLIDPSEWAMTRRWRDGVR